MNPKVSIIILNWNRWEDTIESLETVCQISYSNYQVVLVDNGSGDGSIERIIGWADGKIKAKSQIFKHNLSSKQIKTTIYTRKESKYAECKNEKGFLSTADTELIIIKNERNYGFAEGNNIGIRFAFNDKNVKYVLLLNNDTEIEPNCASKLIEAAESNKSTGSFQPKMLSLTNPRLIDAVGISIDKNGNAAQIGCRVKDMGQYDQVEEIFGSCAGAVLYTRDMLDRIGLFDEDFFSYYEDVDLALRARLAGWKSIYVPTAVVYHKHSSSLGEDSPLKRYFLERNLYYYIIKNLPSDIIFKFLIKRFLIIITTVLYLIKGGKFQIIKYYLKANFDAFKKIPELFKKRKRIQATQHISDKEFRNWLKG